MTVKELVAALNAMPQDIDVILNIRRIASKPSPHYPCPYSHWDGLLSAKKGNIKNCDAFKSLKEAKPNDEVNCCILEAGLTSDEFFEAAKNYISTSPRIDQKGPIPNVH